MGGEEILTWAGLDQLSGQGRDKQRERVGAARDGRWGRTGRALPINQDPKFFVLPVFFTPRSQMNQSTELAILAAKTVIHSISKKLVNFTHFLGL